MAFTSTLVPSSVEQAPAQPATPNSMAPLLATLLLTVYAAQTSKRSLRKLKRQAMVSLFKYKMQDTFARVKSLFTGKKIEGISNTTLLYILLGLLVLVLLFTLPATVAIVVLLIGILLILLTR